MSFFGLIPSLACLAELLDLLPTRLYFLVKFAGQEEDFGQWLFFSGSQKLSNFRFIPI